MECAFGCCLWVDGWVSRARSARTKETTAWLSREGKGTHVGMVRIVEYAHNLLKKLHIKALAKVQ